MQIAELADLAGVTVRTIRYYHQAGVLPEPARLSNGYRDYTVDDLVTVLKIGELTGSGLSLAQAGVLAAGVDDAADEVLDEADRALAAKIAALQAQRRRLRRARAGGHVGLSESAASLSVGGDDVSTAMVFAHLYKDHPQLGMITEVLSAEEMRATLESVQGQFDAIDDSTGEEELDSLREKIRFVIAQFPEELPELTDEQTELVVGLTERNLNPRQLEFLRSLTRAG